MNVDIYWVEEDLVQREMPKRVKLGALHPLIVLPVRRNALPDEYAFAVRCSSGANRQQVGDPPRPRVFAFEEIVKWISTRVNVDNIAMFHNLFPVRRSALTYLVGRGFLDEKLIAAIEKLLAGILWSEEMGMTILPKTSPGQLVPREVRNACPGDIIEIDGSPGVVVSNVAFNRRHALGSLAIVPLIDESKISGACRVAFGSLVAAPEFLKICQPFEGVHSVRPRDERLDVERLRQLIAQVRELLEWGAEAPSLLERGATDGLAMEESKHVCLFATRTRPRKGEAPKHIPLPLSRPIAGASEVFEPILLDSVRYEGPEGSLRVELWDRQGVISLQVVAEEGTLRVINLLSALSQNHSIAVARGPVWPEDWTYSLPIGPVSEVQDQVVEVSIRAPGISEEYTFQLARSDAIMEDVST